MPRKYEQRQRWKEKVKIKILKLNPNNENHFKRTKNRRNFSLLSPLCTNVNGINNSCPFPSYPYFHIIRSYLRSQYFNTLCIFSLFIVFLSFFSSHILVTFVTEIKNALFWFSLCIFRKNGTISEKNHEGIQFQFFPASVLFSNSECYLNGCVILHSATYK